MEMTIVEKNEIKLIGFAFRSTTASDAIIVDSHMKWGEYLANDLGRTIPHRTNQHINLGLMMDYSFDPETSSLSFTYVLGAEVSSLDYVPQGMVGITLPKIKYAVFRIKGNMSVEIDKAWQYIRDQWPFASGYKKAYRGDFVVFDNQKMRQGIMSEAEIYVSVCEV